MYVIFDENTQKPIAYLPNEDLAKLASHFFTTTVPLLKIKSTVVPFKPDAHFTSLMKQVGRVVLDLEKANKNTRDAIQKRVHATHSIDKTPERCDYGSCLDIKKLLKDLK